MAEAAVRALPDLRDANPQLLAMIAGNDYRSAFVARPSASTLAPATAEAAR